MAGTAILSSVERAGELIFESLEFGVFQFRAKARWVYPKPRQRKVQIQGFFASLRVTKCVVGTAILSTVERAGELIFESLEFGVFQLRAKARWGYSNPEFALE
jgi:hypothetical protein